MRSFQQNNHQVFKSIFILKIATMSFGERASCSLVICYWLTSWIKLLSPCSG